MKKSILLLALIYKIMQRSKRGKRNPSWYSSAFISFFLSLLIFSLLLVFFSEKQNRLIGLVFTFGIWLSMLIALNYYYSKDDVIEEITTLFRDKSVAFWSNLEVAFWLAMGSVFCLVVLILSR